MYLSLAQKMGDSGSCYPINKIRYAVPDFNWSIPLETWSSPRIPVKEILFHNFLFVFETFNEDFPVNFTVI